MGIASLRQGGSRIEARRMKLGLLQRDIQNKSVELWGIPGRLTTMMISRIENARVEPTASVLARLGYILDVSPTEMARWYGWPHREEYHDSRFTEAELLANALPDEDRERLYDRILTEARAATKRAEAKVREGV